MTPSSAFPDRLRGIADQVEATFREILSRQPQGRITEAMGHAVIGGKCLRGFLVVAGGEVCGLPVADCLRAAVAIECIHAYSLVHDDLPCMDDDDLRRGHPTVHVKWDEATAVLAGDALQSLAFEILADPTTHADGDIRTTLVAELAHAAGAGGMVLGQARDIAAETASKPLSLDDITALQALKTGALIQWAALAGPRMARADLGPLRVYSEALGLAFQIVDDLLDIEGNEARTGKRVGKDARAGKATFVSHLGIEGARARARDLVDKAEAALAPYGDRAESLAAAARFVLARDR